MIGTDPITTQVFLWLTAIVLIAVVICLCVVGYHAATSWGERARANSAVEDALARTAESNAKQAEAAYQLALLNRVGTDPQITLTVPQAQLDKLATDYVKRRIESIKVKVVASVDG